MLAPCAVRPPPAPSFLRLRKQSLERLRTETPGLWRSTGAHGLWAESGPLKLPEKPKEVGVQVRGSPAPPRGLPSSCTRGGLGP